MTQVRATIGVSRPAFGGVSPSAEVRRYGARGTCRSRALLDASRRGRSVNRGPLSSLCGCSPTAHSRGATAAPRPLRSHFLRGLTTASHERPIDAGEVPWFVVLLDVLPDQEASPLDLNDPDIWRSCQPAALHRAGCPAAPSVVRCNPVCMVYAPINRRPAGGTAYCAACSGFRTSR